MPLHRKPVNPRLLPFLIAGGSIAVIILVIAVASRPVLGKITVDTRPAGAAVLLGEHYCPAAPCDFDLAPGEYKVEASLANYQHAEATVMVTARGSDYKTLHLLPMVPTAEEAQRMGLIRKPEKAGEPIDLGKR